MHRSFGAMVALVATATAKTITIIAGANGELTYTPNNLIADVNDVLEFHFVGDMHTAVQGDFSSPCVQSSTGFDSGTVTQSDVFQVTVMDQNPIWFFCATATHCQSGMVGVVNAPASGETIEIYKAVASGTSSSSSSGKAEGGVVVPGGSAPAPPSSSAVSSSTTAPASTEPASSAPASPPSSSAPAASGTGTGTGSSSTQESTATSASTSVSTSVSTSASGNSTAPSGTGTGTGAATGTGNGTAKATSAPTPASVGNSLGEVTGKLTLWGLAFGMGCFVVLMA